MKVKGFLGLIKTTYKEWNAKDPFRESAVIAYYTIFSLPGLLMVIITLAGYFFGRDTVNSEIITQIKSTMGGDTAKQVQTIIDAASESKHTVWGTIIGIITIVIGATGVFAQMQKSLNNIWGVKPVPGKSGIWKYIRARIFSFGLIVSLAFILMVSLFVSTAITALGDWIVAHFSESLLVVLQVLNFVISLAILMVLFAFMFSFLPDAKIKWKHVWVGAALTALLFELGKFALEIFFGEADPGSGYGAAGSVIIILMWTSYSSMIVFFGAEFTRAYTIKKEGMVKPENFAVKKRRVIKV